MSAPRARGDGAVRATWGALAVLSLGLLSLFVGRDGRPGTFLLAGAALAWFARGSSMSSLPFILPAGPILDWPFLDSPARIYATEILLLAATAWMGARRALAAGDPGRARIRTPLPVILIGAYAAAGAIALAAGNPRLLGSLEGLRGVRVLALAFATAFLFVAIGAEGEGRERILRRWNVATVASLAAIAIAGIAEFALAARGATGRPEPGSFYRQSVQVAVHIALFSPVALRLFFSAEAAPLRLAAGGAWILSMGCLVLTASRGALSSVLVASGIVAAGSARNAPARRAIAIAFAIIAVAAVVLAAKPEIAGESFGRKLRATLAGDLVSSREAAWREELAAIRRHPIFGEGPSATGSSLYLELARRHGIPAAAFAVLGIAAAAFSALRTSRGLGIGAGLLGLLIVGFAETCLGARTTPLVTSAVAIACLAALPSSRREGEGHPAG